jgi:hypothetical protein
MNTSSGKEITKPNITEALISGFNTIANKPYLMLLPIILDLFLWFGPAWRVDAYFKPMIQSLPPLPGLETAESAAILESYQLLWQDLIENLDLAFTLRTLPIGVPSLMVSKTPFINPLGASPVFNLVSHGQVLGFFVIFLVLGYLLGNFYYKKISNQIIKMDQETGIKSFLRTYFQIILIPFVLIFLLFILSIPYVLMTVFITLMVPTFSQISVIIMGIIILWILMPLIFTPHSIFLYRQNIISAMITSINVVRTSMGKTAWFILLSFVMIEGFNYLWRTPPADNWFLLIGIFGHAFMVTSVITASFYYFLDATQYTQTLINQNIKAA